MSQSKSESKSRVNGTGVSIPDLSNSRDLEYREDYREVMQVIKSNTKAGHPIRLVKVVKSVYSGDYTSAQYKRIRDFCKKCDYVEVISFDGYVQIEARFSLFKSDVSNTQKQQTATGLEKDNSSSGLQTDTREKYPKERLESLLNKVTQINSPDHADHRHETKRELEIYRDNISDTYSIFEHRLNEQYLAIPNTTRFTDSTDASKSQSRFYDALDNAHERFSEGIVISATIDPKRFTSHAEAIEATREAKKNLLSWLRYQIGDSPTQVTIPDFQTKTGLLHYHIVLFGIERVPESENKTGEPTISESQVREYWDNKRDIGSQVSVERTWTQRDNWLLHRDDSRVSLSYYLGKRVRELVDLAGLETGEVPLKYWKHALFWVYNMSYVTCSESLKESQEDEHELSNTLEWDYIGTCRFDQIPSHYLDNMILVGTSG